MLYYKHKVSRVIASKASDQGEDKLRRSNPIIFVYVVLFSRLVLTDVLVVDKINGPFTTIQSAVDKTAPGDTVLVKAGTYHEKISTSTGGTENARITIKAYPDEKVTVDGSVPLTEWTQCASQQEAGGNPNWQNIYYTTAPESTSILIANMYEGDSLFHWSQHPEPADNFFDTDPTGFIPVPTNGFTATTIVDPANLTQSEDDFWVGGYVKVHTGPNIVVIKKIVDYSAADHKITFEDLDNTINPGKDSYAVGNHISLIDKPGKVCIDESSQRIYYWPRSVSSLTDSTITLSTLDEAFRLNGESNLCVEGFTVRRYQSRGFTGSSAHNVVIRNNTITQCTSIGRKDPIIYMFRCTTSIAEDNYLFYNKYNTGIVFQQGVDNIMRNNTLDTEGSTGADFYTEINSQMVGNTVLNHRGVHANGLTLYLDCKDVVVAKNRVFGGHNALTFQDVDGITIVNNIFHGANRANAVACWNGSTSKNVTLYHNIMIGVPKDNWEVGLYHQSGDITNLTMINNIIDGTGALSGNIRNNLYTAIGKNQGALQEGEFEQSDLSKIFIDPAKYDFRLKEGSPAIDTGVDLSAEGINDDIVGTARPQDNGWDIGPYEYTEQIEIIPQTIYYKSGRYDLRIITGNGSVSFFVTLPGNENGSLVIYNVQGKRVEHFKVKTSGERCIIVWYAYDRNSSGCYIAILKSSADKSLVKRFILSQ